MSGKNSGIAARQLRFVGLLSVLNLMWTAAAMAQSLSEAIDAAVMEHAAAIVEVRRDIHRHPEVAGQEIRTAKVVAEHLRACGLEVRTGVGGHGVVGVLRGGRPGPVVAYRADMDAMASEAPDPVDFASVNPGVRHICGHDVHVAVGLGIAEVLAANRKQLPGTVVFLFQPAEETAAGARAMLEDGALANPRPRAVFAVHCAPLPTGRFGSMAGMMLPGLDLVEVTLVGSGNLQAAAAQVSDLLGSLNTTGGLAPEHKDTAAEAMDAAFRSPGFINAGIFESAAVDDEWKLKGMVRASSEALHAQARRSIESGLESLELGDVRYQLDYTAGAIAPVHNDAVLVTAAEKVIRAVDGPEAVVPLEETTPFFSEDFSFFQKEIPGVLFFLGVANEEKGILGMPHHPQFVADEAAIPIAIRTMSRVLVDHLETHAAD